MAAETKLTDSLVANLEELLSSGVTIKVACAELGIGRSTYYNWLEIGRALKEGREHHKAPSVKAQRQRIMDMVDCVTRAQGRAHVGATVTLRNAFTNAQESVEETTETFEETRLDKQGKPYTYRRVVTKHKVVTVPPDWRAALEYLKRRDPDNWSERHVHREESALDEIIRDIQNGTITLEDYPLVEEEYGSELANELFRAAGHEVQVGPGTPEGNRAAYPEDGSADRRRSGWLD